MNNLLGVNLQQFISEPLILIGLILLTIGLATTILAKRIARVARQTNNVPNNDRIYVVFKVLGLLLMLAGFICISVDIIIYIVNKK